MSMAKNSLIGALIIQGTIILLNLIGSFGVEMSADMVSSGYGFFSYSLGWISWDHHHLCPLDEDGAQG